MLNSFAVKAINLLLDANIDTKSLLAKYSTKIVKINLPLVSVQFIIASDGGVETESEAPDCTINIPLSTASHVIHKNELKTYKSLDIEGDKTLAKDLLEILATIKVTRVLYLSDNPLMNMFAVQLEKILTSLVDYAKMVSDNAASSISQYVQYESNEVVDKFDLDKFSQEVDELNSRYELLAKRVERISQ